jgi:valyl-tRNA synthetase
LLTDFTYASELITQVRNTRKQKNLSPKEKVSLFAKDAGALKSKFNDVIIRLTNLG